MMQAGLGVLKLPAAQFWAFTPKELSAALSAIIADDSASTLCREDLDELMARFPDKEKPHD